MPLFLNQRPAGGISMLGGVSAQPRVQDILRIIEGQTAQPSTEEARSTVVKMLEALWSAWPGLDGREKAYVNALRTSNGCQPRAMVNGGTSLISCTLPTISIFSHRRQVFSMPPSPYNKEQAYCCSL